MSVSQPEMVKLDRIAPDLKILALFSALSRDTTRPFTELKRDLRISDSLLSKRLGALSVAGLVRLTVETSNGRSRKLVTLTDNGRQVYRQHSEVVSKLLATRE